MRLTLILYGKREEDRITRAMEYLGRLQSVVQTKEGRILDRGRSNQPWPAGAEAEADEADADDAAAHFQLVAKLTNTNPTVSQSGSQLFTQKRAASSIGVAQISVYTYIYTTTTTTRATTTTTTTTTTMSPKQPQRLPETRFRTVFRRLPRNSKSPPGGPGTKNVPRGFRRPF